MTSANPRTSSQPAPTTPSASGWRGVALIAITYVYFLIFAQFAFLHRLAQLHIADAHLKAVMAAMALGGILFSLLTPRVETSTRLSLNSRRARSTRARSTLQAALALCAAAALLLLLPLSLPASIAVAFLIGASLGTLTVTLVTHLRLWLGTGNHLLKVGLGTGLGYLLCNFPPLFTAPPEAQALTAATLCIAAVFLAAQTTPDPIETAANFAPPAANLAAAIPATNPDILSGAGAPDGRSLPVGVGAKDPCSSSSGKFQGQPTFPLVLLAFTALIWLDSAAFFIIQSTPALKAGTWQGTTHLYLNGALHLAAALGSVYLLRRRGLSTTLTFALLALAAACLLLLDPHRALLASLFYPIGVSLYSVALVAYPALLSPATTIAQRARQAGLLYAIGGWFGSAMGIGTGQHLGHIPPLFVLAAAALILTPTLLQTRRRELLATAAILLASFGLWRTVEALTPTPPPLTQIQRGRQVYISEGCINCHSQYVRPNTPDVLMWGPTQTLADLRAEHPPLIGNRRQGPDLSQVGSRRSPLWLRAHFYEPSQVSHDSIMPSYAYLFRTPPGTQSRGDDLVAYLQSLRPQDDEQDPTQDIDRLLTQRSWQPSAAAFAAASATHGQQLFTAECATCHTANGTTRNQWRASFHRLPPILTRGPLLDIPSHPGDAQRDRLAQIVKFGIPGTDMPGHEYLSDADVASLTLWLQQNIAQPQPTATNAPSHTPSHGDIR
jgi:cytochrome c oxidase cbb3-type subunit 2